MVKIASAIQQWRCPLRYLDVSNTGLSKHGIGNILASIAGNQNVYTTLEYLNVGDNKVQLISFLRWPNILTAIFRVLSMSMLRRLWRIWWIRRRTWRLWSWRTRNWLAGVTLSCAARWLVWTLAATKLMKAKVTAWLLLLPRAAQTWNVR